MVKKSAGPIPDSVLIPACNAVLADSRYSGKCADKWGEAEASACRELCGPEYAFVETDWIRHRAINLRKAHKLVAVNGGPKRRKLKEPDGKYAEYLASDHWQTFRVEVLEFWEFKCCLCSDQARDVHHRTYVRLGMERLCDCVALCRDCHKRVHGAMPDGNEELNSTGDQLF